MVVDGDLRSSEMTVLQSLAGLGKRLLLVLNKRDLRGAEEERRLLQLLRNRCNGLMSAADVVACSAAPQSVPRAGWTPCSRLQMSMNCCSGWPPSCMKTVRS